MHADPDGIRRLAARWDLAAERLDAAAQGFDLAHPAAEEFVTRTRAALRAYAASARGAAVELRRHSAALREADRLPVSPKEVRDP